MTIYPYTARPCRHRMFEPPHLFFQLFRQPRIVAIKKATYSPDGVDAVFLLRRRPAWRCAGHSESALGDRFHTWRYRRWRRRRRPEAPTVDTSERTRCAWRAQAWPRDYTRNNDRYQRRLPVRFHTIIPNATSRTIKVTRSQSHQVTSKTGRAPAGRACQKILTNFVRISR